MAPAELREVMEKLDLASDTFAELCGVGPNVVARWRQDPAKRYALPVPRYAETILALVAHVKSLEAYAAIPEASRLSTGSRSRPKPPPRTEAADADGSRAPESASEARTAP
jgi:hypothetical protein